MPLKADDFLQAAYLSENTYLHSVPGGQLENGWRLLSYVDLGISLNQWNTETNDATNSPYVFDVGRSQAIVAVRGSQIVLAFRGSEPGERADFSDAAYTQLGHYQNFAPLIAALNNYLAGKNLDFIVTGHSLGGALAEIYITHDARAIDSPKLITFGSPGVNTSAIGSLPVASIAEHAAHIVHTGDPVTYAQALLPFDSGGTLDASRTVQIDLPEFVNGPSTSFGQLLDLNRWIEFALQTEEHAMALYRVSINFITLSAVLFTEFSLNPGAFDVTLSNRTTLFGDSGRDYLIGTSVDQEMFGGSGSDLIAGLSGIDRIYGGTEADIIEGGGGADLIDGGHGSDIVYGGSGEDSLRGGGGNDQIYGGHDEDTAHYEFGRTSYSISWSVDHFVIQASGGLAFEGTDHVYEVENFVFNGVTFVATQLFTTPSTSSTPAPPPTTPTPLPTSYGDTGSAGTLSQHISGTDIHGDTRSTSVMVADTAASPSPGFSSTIGSPGDVDYVRINLVAGVTYRFLMEGISTGGMSPLADTFFRIRDGRDLSVLNPNPLNPTNLNNHDQIVGNNAQVDFVAPYSGLYFVSLGAGGPSFQTLTGGYRITATATSTPPVNQNPVIGADSYVANFGATINGNLISNDSDPNPGTQLAADLVNGLVTTRGGNVIVLPNGAFQYIAPALGSNSNDTFAYTVRDGSGGSAVGTVTIQLQQPTAPLPSVPVFTNGSDVVNIPLVPANAGWIFYALDGNDILYGSPGGSHSGGYQVFGGEGDDTFYPNGFGGVLHGGPGNDYFVASLAGGEMFDGDTFNEYNNDSDTADFSRLSNRIVAEVGNGTVVSGGITYSIALVENIIGTELGDEIRGVGAGNTLSINNVYTGLGGIDVLFGYVGNDDLYGGTGNDSLYGGDGDDNLFGGEGDDDLHGGNGGANDGRNYLDGGTGNDDIRGGAQDDVLTGGDGDDFVVGDEALGQPGNDYIIASAGTDRILGLDGTDTLDFSNAPSGSSGSASIAVSGWGVTTLSEIEILIATNFSDDLQAAPGLIEIRLGDGDDRGSNYNASPTMIWGGAGNDWLFGLGTSDTFYGGTGDDVLFLNEGSNTGYGEDGDDQIYAGSGDDILTGGNGADRINAGDGVNQIDGGGGDDQIDSGSGVDTINAGTGADRITAGGGSDTLNGGLGADTMVGGLGNDSYVVDDAGDVVTETSDGGTDTVQTTLALYGLAANVENLTFTDNAAHTGFGNQLANIMTGGSGSDTLVGHANVFDAISDTLNGGGGNDTIYGEASDIMQGGEGKDFLYIANSNPITISMGATSIEWIQTDFGNDVFDASTQTVGIEVYSDGGNDTITGSSFNDIIWSGSGNDTVNGGDGNDVIVADIGIDDVSGGNGDDRLYVDASDTVTGGGGFDAVYVTGGTGMSLNLATSTIDWIADFVGGNDTFNGSGLSVRMEAFAASGNDMVTGGSGNDFLWGGTGNDTVSGNSGNDTLVGEAGADILTGGLGVDALYGNSGNGGDGAIDTFVFTSGWGMDFVFDFENGIDKFDMTALGTNFGALSITADGAHTRITLGSDMFIVANTTPSLLDATDFLF